MAIFVGISSNLNDPPGRVREAIRRIAREPGIRLMRCSSLYRTAPWGILDQPLFCNAVVEIECSLEPAGLLARLQDIEDEMGRSRPPVKWGPRLIDLDLLIYHARRISTPDLALPHPHIRERVFVLAPLLEIAPNAGEPGVCLPYRASLAPIRRPGDAEPIEPAPPLPPINRKAARR